MFIVVYCATRQLNFKNTFTKYFTNTIFFQACSAILRTLHNVKYFKLYCIVYTTRTRNKNLKSLYDLKDEIVENCLCHSPDKFRLKINL